MNVTRSAVKLSQWMAFQANHDFCPWANKYVYWLKEPIGWFVLATLTSILIGLFFSPFGWTLAAGLVAVIALGLGFPLIAMLGIRCELRPANNDLHEGEATHLILAVHNRLPFPVMGLMIQGYLTVPPAAMGDEMDPATLDCGLARVPAWSRAAYRLPVVAEYRGRYPMGKPQLSCAFPFGIYTARKDLASLVPVTVKPRVLPLVAELEWGGSKLADVGQGHRATQHGDFLGVREFRRGDSLRSIHWVQSARHSSLIVCERGGPQRSPVVLHLSTERCDGSARDARDNLAWRVRVIATLADMLAARHMPFALCIDGRQVALAEGLEGVRRVWLILADVPLDSPPLASSRNPAMQSPGGWERSSQQAAGIYVHVRAAEGGLLEEQFITLEIKLADSDRANSAMADVSRIDLEVDIASQLTHALRGVAGVHCAA